MWRLKFSPILIAMMNKALFAILPFAILSLYAKNLTVGSDAPAFSLLDENGEKWNSGDFLGKKNILIFLLSCSNDGWLH